jgi:hypothetical protein
MLLVIWLIDSCEISNRGRSKPMQAPNVSAMTRKLQPRIFGPPFTSYLQHPSHHCFHPFCKMSICRRKDREPSLHSYHRDVINSLLLDILLSWMYHSLPEIEGDNFLVIWKKSLLEIHRYRYRVKRE